MLNLILDKVLKQSLYKLVINQSNKLIKWSHTEHENYWDRLVYKILNKFSVIFDSFMSHNPKSPTSGLCNETLIPAYILPQSYLPIERPELLDGFCCCCCYLYFVPVVPVFLLEN